MAVKNSTDPNDNQTPENIAANAPPPGSGGSGAPGANGVFGVEPIVAPTIAIADYKFTDPLQMSLDALDKRLNAFEKVFDFTGKLLDKLPGYEFGQNANYFNQADPFLRRAIDSQNQFNQGQLNRQIDQAAPGARNAFSTNLGIANNFAQGRFSDNVLDSAFEVNSRGMAANNLNAAGYGNTGYTRDLNDKFSVMQRLNLQQFGIQASNATAGQMVGTLTSQPTRLSTAEQFPGKLSYSPAQAALGTASQQYASGVVDATTAASQEIQQQQFRTSQVQGVNSQQAAFKMQAATTNAANSLATQQLNYGAALNEQAVAANNQAAQDANAAAANGREVAAGQQNVQAGLTTAGGILNSSAGKEIIGQGIDVIRDYFNDDDEESTRAPDGSPSLGSEEENGGASDSGGGGNIFPEDEGLGEDVEYTPSTDLGGDAETSYTSASDLPDLQDRIAGYSSKAASVNNAQIVQSFKDLPQAALNGAVAYSYDRHEYTQSAQDKAVRPIDPAISNQAKYYGMGEPQAPSQIDLVSSNGNYLRSSLAAGMTSESSQLAGKILGHISQDSFNLANVDKNGNISPGLPPDKVGLDIAKIPFGSLNSGQAKEYGEQITRDIKGLQFNDWRTNMKAAPELIGKLIADQGFAAAERTDTQGNVTLEKTDMQGNTVKGEPASQAGRPVSAIPDRNAAELSRGLKTYDWASRQLKQLGIGVNLPDIAGDDDAKAEFGARLFDTVKNGHTMSPTEKAQNMAQLVVAYHGSLSRGKGG